MFYISTVIYINVLQENSQSNLTVGAAVAVCARQSGKNRELADQSFLVASFHQKTGVTQLPSPIQICNLEENKT